MHTETIIKLIGRRPVYRVERNPSSGFRIFEDHSGSIPQAAPVVDRQNWQHTTDGLGEGSSPDLWY